MVLQISSDGDDRRNFGFDILAPETFWGRKIWQSFFLGGLIKVGNFGGYSKQSVDSDVMMNKQTQTFNFCCSYFPCYVV